MRYYLDCEFNGFGGVLLSMALVREDGAAFHSVSTFDFWSHIDPWVRENVMPNLHLNKTHEHHFAQELSPQVAAFLAGDPAPHIIADWPDDFTYLIAEILTGPGTMIDIPGLTMEVVRVDAYPTDLPGAIQHNAYWDAMALRHKLTGAA